MAAASQSSSQVRPAEGIERVILSVPLPRRGSQQPGTTR